MDFASSFPLVGIGAPYHLRTFATLEHVAQGKEEAEAHSFQLVAQQAVAGCSGLVAQSQRIAGDHQIDAHRILVKEVAEKMFEGAQIRVTLVVGTAKAGQNLVTAEAGKRTLGGTLETEAAARMNWKMRTQNPVVVASM